MRVAANNFEVHSVNTLMDGIKKKKRMKQNINSDHNDGFDV